MEERAEIEAGSCLGVAILGVHEGRARVEHRVGPGFVPAASRNRK